MRSSDYYKSGEWNFTCDFCGRKAKSGESMKTWDNFRVCAFHKEVRNPQDFVRGVKDNQTVPWSRPPAPVTFVSYPAEQCTLQGTNAIQAWAIPGSVYPNHINVAFLPSYPGNPPDIYPQTALPGWAIPGQAIPGVAMQTV